MMKRVATFQPLFLAVLLAAGFGIVWGFVVGWGISMVEQAARANRVYESLVVRADGTPMIQSYSGGDYYNRTYRTLDGQTLAISPQEDWLTGASLAGVKQRRGRFFGLPWSQRIMWFEDGGRPVTFWYLIHNGELDGAAYFVGYSSKTKTLDGYIGLKGFRTTQPPPDELFPIDGRIMGRYRYGVVYREHYYFQAPYYSSGYVVGGRTSGRMVYLLSENRLLEIDLRRRAVRAVFESEELLAVSELSRAVPPAELEDPMRPPALREYLAVRSPDRIFVIDPNRGEHDTYAIPDQWRDRQLTFYQLSDKRALVHQSHRSRQGISKNTLIWLDQQGNELDRKEVLLGSKTFFDDPGVTAGVVALVVPAPAIATSVDLVGMAYALYVPEEDLSYSNAFARALSESWPALLMTHVLGVVLAWLCYRRERQYGTARRWVWVVFVFLFGVPGMAGYLLQRRWPVREACPECGKPAPRDRESCFACGRQFPEPALKGTEVLA